MILKDLFMNIEDGILLKTIVDLYPEEQPQLFAYKKVLNNLKDMQPDYTENPASEYLILFVNPKKEGASVVDEVYGYSHKTDKKYACELMPFNQWLAMEVSEDSLKQYGRYKFLAHVLYEMTYVSFDELKIKEQSDYINQLIEDIRKEL